MTYPFKIQEHRTYVVDSLLLKGGLHDANFTKLQVKSQKLCLRHFTHLTSIFEDICIVRSFDSRGALRQKQLLGMCGP